MNLKGETEFISKDENRKLNKYDMEIEDPDNYDEVEEVSEEDAFEK